MRDDVPPAVALAAAKDALDRAGLSAKTAVELSVGQQLTPSEFALQWTTTHQPQAA